MFSADYATNMAHGEVDFSQGGRMTQLVRNDIDQETAEELERRGVILLAATARA